MFIMLLPAWNTGVLIHDMCILQLDHLSVPYAFPGECLIGPQLAMSPGLQVPSTIWPSRISIAALLPFVPHVHGLVTADDVCEHEYQEKMDMWQSMSGATTEHIPMGHRPDWYREEIMKRRFIPTSQPISGYEDFWLEQLVEQARMQAVGCSVHGGRYWEITLDFQRLFDLMVRGTRFTLLRLMSLRIAQTESLLQTREDLPGMLRMSVCMPYSCDEQMLIDRIFPHFFAPSFMGPKAARKLSNASFQDVVQVNELQDWTSFNIDFAIVGTDCCGTSSLHQNLEKHPEVTFSTVHQDDFWIIELAHRLLPFKKTVDRYNTQVESIREDKFRRSGSRPLLIGVCHPIIFSSDLAKHILAAMPQVKTIMILCDPVNRLEKFFMFYGYCLDDLRVADAVRRKVGAPLRDGSPCFNSSTALISEKDGKLKQLWQQREMAKHMPGLMHLFYGRTFLLHQEQLQENPHRVFNSIAKFLGVTRSFPEDTKFPRYNSIGGYRTDLCYNTTLVRELQEHLEPEYLMQEAILRAAKVSIPPSLRLRRTRCHNLATAEVTYCPLTECA